MAGVANAVRRFLTHTRLREHPGVVAVSGGADSVALLRSLAAKRVPLTVAHFNHQLRGAESDADAAFVRDLAERLGLPFRLGEADVAKAATDAGENLEATARRLRYAWLADVAAEVGAKWVATGHTADDQAETVLHRLIRGTGLQGLRGVAADRDDASGLRIVRPLLAVTRAEILDFLASLNQPSREDASNADPRFTRNRIRAELLPRLKTFNPEVVRALGRLAEQANDAYAVLAEQGRGLLATAERPRVGETIVLDAGALMNAPPIVLREALRLLWQREGWPVAAMGFDEWGRAVEVARRYSGGWDFPGGVSARHRGHVVQIGRGL